MLEGTKQSLARSGGRIASARSGLGLISLSAMSICNCGTRGNGLFQHFLRDMSAQFLSAILN